MFSPFTLGTQPMTTDLYMMFSVFGSLAADTPLFLPYSVMTQLVEEAEEKEWQEALEVL